MRICGEASFAICSVASGVARTRRKPYCRRSAGARRIFPPPPLPPGANIIQLFVFVNDGGAK